MRPAWWSRAPKNTDSQFANLPHFVLQELKCYSRDLFSRMEKHRTTSAPFLKVASDIEKLLKPCSSQTSLHRSHVDNILKLPGSQKQICLRPPTIGQRGAVEQLTAVFQICQTACKECSGLVLAQTFKIRRLKEAHNQDTTFYSISEGIFVVKHPENKIQTGGRVDQNIEHKAHLSLETYDVVVTLLEYLLAALILWI